MAGEQLSWRERKARYLAHLAEIDDDAVLRVALADKVHNARSIVRDYRAEGQRLWERFGSRTAQDQLGYYTRLLELFAARREGPLVEDLRHAVGELGGQICADRRDARVGLPTPLAPARTAGGPDERPTP